MQSSQCLLKLSVGTGNWVGPVAVNQTSPPEGRQQHCLEAGHFCSVPAFLPSLRQGTSFALLHFPCAKRCKHGLACEEINPKQAPQVCKLGGDLVCCSELCPGLKWYDCADLPLECFKNGVHSIKAPYLNPQLLQKVD